MNSQYERARPEDADRLTQIAIAAKRHWDYPERWIELWTPVLAFTPEVIAVPDVWAGIVENGIPGFYALT